MTQKELFEEVLAVVEAAIERGEVVPAHSVTVAIVASHDDIKGEDADWYLLCGMEHVRDTVREVLRRYKPTADPTPEQILLPGMERLQIAYLTDRDGDQVVVPIDQLTDIEIERKATELESMAMGCLQHAKELRRYRVQRSTPTLVG